MKKTTYLSNEIESLIEIFQNFKDLIYGYNYPEELFGELKGDYVDEKMDSLKDKFRKLMLDYGADRYNHYDNRELINISSEITRRIIEFENLAEQAIYDETYGTKRNNNRFVLTGKYEYQVNSLDSEGDFSQTFLGSYKNGNGEIENVCIKMARIVDDDNILFDDGTIELNNDSINHEINTLKYLDSIKDTVFQKVRRQHFPIVVDDFMAPSGYVNTDIKRCTMVTKHVPAYDFVTLREKFPNGVPLYHGCWMFARILSGVGHLHFQKGIHGNIHPEGLFVTPQVHNVTLADLEFSILDYTSPRAKYLGATEYYTAPEVYKGATPHPRTDIYSIAMSILYILGGDIEKRTLPDTFEMTDNVNPDKEERERGIEGIRNLILSCVHQHPLARSDDAWHSYHQLSNLRHLAFGKPSFREFVVDK